MRRSERVKRTLQDTLWVDAIVLAILFTLIGLFGFPLWLLFVIVVAAAVVSRRAYLSEQRRTRGIKL